MMRSIHPELLTNIWRALEMEHLSQQELCKGNLEGGSFAGDLEGYVEEGSGDGHLSPWGPAGVPGRGVHLPGVYVLKKALETDIYLHGGPVKNLRGSSVYREF
jgi:hypothetical protein